MLEMRNDKNRLVKANENDNLIIPDMVKNMIDYCESKINRDDGRSISN